MRKYTGRVYSYLRFSDPKQAHGSSADRQKSYAAEWATKHGLVLDENLSLRDEGLSAFHQKHVKKGALGVFLKAVDEGRVPSGSVLIVESLDRLSRADVDIAMAQLLTIIHAGIRVVTANDGREYSSEVIKGNPIELITSVTFMMRANEESATKSKRVRASLRRQAQGWQAGTFRGIIHAGSDPNWVLADRVNKRFELIPERVEAVRMALDLFRAGNGLVRIARLLEENGLVLSETAHSQISGIRNLLRLEALLGRRTVTIDRDESYVLEGYYPAVITPEEFAEIQQLLGQRVRRGSKSPIPAIITGLHLTRCGYCGQMIVAQNNHSKSVDERGLPTNGYRKMLCNSYHRELPCRARGTIPAPLIERAVIEYCSDQMNLTALLEADNRHKPLQAKVNLERGKLAKLETNLDRIMQALLDDESGAPPTTFVKKARQLESEIETSRATLQELEYELEGLGDGTKQVTSSAWYALLDGVLNLDFDARSKARRLVADTFEGINIYMRGIKPGREDQITVVLRSKRDVRRCINVDRKSGEWVDATDDLRKLEQVEAEETEQLAARRASVATKPRARRTTKKAA